MRVLKRSVPLWIAAFASLLLHAVACGQDVVPTPEQLEMLRTLTPEQRDALMRQIMGGGAGSQSSTRREDRDQRDQNERTGDLDRARTDELRDSLDRDTQLESRIPVLQGEDFVIITISIAREPVPGATPAVVAAPAAAGQAPATVPAQAVVPVPLQDVSVSAEERARLDAIIELVRSRNPYQLSRDGVLLLPGFPQIALAGLTEFQATVRLQAEPTLRNLAVSLIRLPLKKTGAQALKPFGYDLFERAPSTFAPVTNVPVPADYVVGPGDELVVQLYGNQSRTHTLTVGRDGRVSFPELGPINVGGQRFNDAKASIESRVANQMIGVRASVSMGDTRSIRVFVLGETKRPGSYTISGLGTITSALFAAGGARPIGSLRHIQLRRQGELVRELDLYDMLIRGDTTDDAKVLPGDVIFVPTVGATLSVDGEVRRPAIYEIKDEATVAEVVQLAGGLTAEADTTRATLTRIDEAQRRVVMQVDPSNAAAAAARLRNGDLLRIERLRPTLDAGVVLQGHVFAAGALAFTEGMRLSNAIRSVDELKPNADLHYVLIRRELPPDRHVVALSADLVAALRSPGSEDDVPLMPRDQITVFDLESGRDRVIRPLIEELRLQSRFARPTEVVRVDGRAKAPGEYPLEPGMTVSDLIRAGGSLEDAAYGGTAELTRYRVVNGESRRTELIRIELNALLRGEAGADIPLQPFDSLSIKEVPEWGEEEWVSLMGEVRFPGRYSIKRGETLKSVLNRAGGLSEYAFAEGSIFTREELKSREQKQLDVLARRLQNDLATLALQGAAANQAQAGTALTVGQALLSQIRTSQAVGRLVIDLPRTLRAQLGTGADIIMRNGDQLMVPRYQQEVTVIGEVQNATSHLYRPELNRDDYISLSGGMTRKADSRKIYVVRANGSVIANEGARWFSRSSVEIKPGDTVVVPLDTERLPALPFWQAVVQIVANLAISAAAVNSFDNN